MIIENICNQMGEECLLFDFLKIRMDELTTSNVYKMPQTSTLGLSVENRFVASVKSVLKITQKSVLFIITLSINR
jgi:hypothetical protein